MFQMKNYDSLLIFAQNIDRGYMLEPPQSNEYHNLCFRAKQDNNVYQCKLKFYYIKWGVRGSTLHGHVSMMIMTKRVTGSVLSVCFFKFFGYHINYYKKKLVPRL